MRSSLVGSRLVATWFLALVAACGGGGTGGGGDGAPRLTFDTPTLTFVGIQGVQLDPRDVQIVASGTGTFYPSVWIEPSDAWERMYRTSAPNTITVTVRPAFAVDRMTMPPGRTSGVLTVRLCHDPSCTSVATSASLPLETDIVAVSRAPIALQGIEGLASAGFDLEVTPSTAADTVSATASEPTPSSMPLPWLSVGHAGSAIHLAASAAGVLAGSYAGELRLGRTGVSGRLAVPVTFLVQPGTVAPPSTSLPVTAATTGAALTGTLPVAFQPGLAPAWAASSSQPWLRLTAPATAGAGSLTWTVDAGGLAAMDDWATTVATITIEPAGMAAVRSTFSVVKQLPEIRSAATPLVAGRATDARVFGRGFSQLADVGGLAVTGASGLTGTIVSDREARLQGLALSAGRHTVSARNALSLPTATAPIDAVAPDALYAASVASAGQPLAALLDAVHGQVFVAKTDKLVRLRREGGTWAADELAAPNIQGIALARDGSALYASTGTYPSYAYYPLHEVDPTTLVSIASYFPSGMIDDLGGRPPPVFSADGRLWFPASGWSNASYFDLATRRFFAHRQTPPVLFSSPGFAASADGSRVCILPSMASVEYGGTYQDYRPWCYAPETDRFEWQPAAPQELRMSLSADGGRALSLHSVYDTTTWTLLGSAELDGGATGSGIQLSPDGRRVYRTVETVVSAEEGSLTVVRIDVFDVDAVAPGTAQLVKRGEIPVGARISGCWYGNCAEALAVSPIGDALVVAGNEVILVIPIPAALSGVGP